jgi:signal transduction histidine kinase
MLSGLRSRLLVSYIAVIGLTLCIVGLALFLLLINSPLPTRTAYKSLETIARTASSFLRGQPEALDRRLAYIAEANDIRVLRIESDGTVLYDSADLAVGQQLSLRAGEQGAVQADHGTYRGPDGRLWLYVAMRPAASSPASGLIVFATLRPRGALFTALGENLLRPLLEAGAIGVILAMILAALISRSVARPLHQTAEAANAIAGGDYGHPVPEQGPDEVRNLAHAFNDMMKQVQRTQQTQRDFLANVSHELKTPLTSIQGYSQAVLDGTAADPSRAAQVIYDEAGRMKRLVEDLLDLARIESGQAPLRRDHVRLETIINAVLANLSLEAGEKSILLAHRVSELPGLTGDGDRLAQVFTNLVDNAITHTPPGGQVTVDAAQNAGGVEVVVSDTGPGIPPEELGRVFERFYQVDKSRARSGRKGTGLGLTISKEIILAHGGRIWAESSNGEGAAVHVWLPLPRPSDETVHGRTARR